MPTPVFVFLIVMETCWWMGEAEPIDCRLTMFALLAAIVCASDTVMFVEEFGTIE